MTTYMLGRRSRAELHEVHPQICSTVERAIKITPVDFSVHDGIRTHIEQKEYVAQGVSKTMNSYHLPQEDGYGHAVDLVPYINGKMRWEWDPIYKIAAAMHQAAEEEGILLRWGACWDRVFNDLDVTDLKDEVESYIERRKKNGLDAFLDGPHFELFDRRHHRWNNLFRPPVQPTAA